MVRSLGLLAQTLLAALLWSALGAYGQQDFTKCLSSQLDWYTDAVGETPCVTYQRLRQICNNDYTVGQFRKDTPGDNCGDQVSACCCNSIAWALSMLCFNCQFDVAGETDGVDAGVGGYQLYLGGCGQKAADQTLAKDIQQAVCNKEIKIDRNLYSLFWPTGAWYYTYTKGTMLKDFAATNNNTFTHCASTTRNDTDTTSSLTPSLTASAGASATDTSAPSEKSNIGPIIGGAVGGVLGLLAIIGVVVFFLRKGRRSRRGPKPLDLSNEYTRATAGRYSDDDPPMATVTPFSPSTHTGPRSPPSSASGPAGGSAYTGTGLASGSGTGSGTGSQSHYSSRPSKFGPPPPSYPAQDVEEAERHEDGGPVPYLQRSASGRLPPAYRQSWDVDADADVNVDVGGGPIEEFGEGIGGAGAGAGPGAVSELGSVQGSSVVGAGHFSPVSPPPPLPRDVKVRPAAEHL